MQESKSTLVKHNERAGVHYGSSKSKQEQTFNLWCGKTLLKNKVWVREDLSSGTGRLTDKRNDSFKLVSASEVISSIVLNRRKSRILGTHTNLRFNQGSLQPMAYGIV